MRSSLQAISNALLLANNHVYTHFATRFLQFVFGLAGWGVLGLRVSTMGAKTPPTKLNDVKPTVKELQEARALLDKVSASEMRSKMGCMTHFAKTNKDCDATTATGDLRQKYLEAFLVDDFSASNL